MESSQYKRRDISPSIQFRILCIDGGGMRGLIPALLLKKLEHDLKKPLSEVFHVIAGTSTGGILALNLSKKNPKPAEQLPEDYTKRGHDIFPKHAPHPGLFSAKYDGHGFEKFLEDQFGDMKFSDFERDKAVFLGTAYDISRGEPFFFRSWKASGHRLHKDEKAEDFDFKLIDAARSTSSAPTYFPPSHCFNAAGKEFWFIDGGIVANNPSVCAVSNTLAIFHGIPIENILVVSIGTGVKKHSHDSIVETVKHGGALGWATKIVDLILDGTADVEEEQMERIFQGSNYFRFQVSLDFNKGMDDSSPENLNLLTQAATEAIEGKWKQDYEKLHKILEAPRTEWQLLRDTFPDSGSGYE